LIGSDKKRPVRSLPAKQAPHRPVTAPALGLRAGCVVAPIVVAQTTIAKEIPMWFRTLFDALKTRSARKPARRTPRPASACRPRLEALEDRCLLSFSPAVSYPIAGYGQCLMVGDFNGDNTPDLLGLHSSPTGSQSSTSRVLQGNSDGTFQAARDTGRNIGSPATVADFNRDGKDDVLTWSTSGVHGDLNVLWSNGDGTFSRGPNLLTTGEYAVSVTLGDGNPDIVARSFTVVLYGDEHQGYYSEYVHYVDEWTVGSGPLPAADLQAPDFNRDGHSDRVWVDSGAWDEELGQYVGGSVIVELGDGTGGFQAPLFFTAGAGPVSVVARDFNGDGWVDLAVGNSTSDDASVLLNDGNWPPPGSLSLRISDVAVVEGNTGTASAAFTVTLSDNPQQTVTVAYSTADGSATAGSDYLATSGFLTFTPGGPLSQTISIPVLGDSLAEFTELLAVNLSTPVGALVARGVGVGTILDDEPYVSIAEGPSILEGNSGTTDAVFTVHLSAVSDAPVTVHFATADIESWEHSYWSGASAGSDYQAASGSVTFAPGQTVHTITVPVNGDRLAEANEVFRVNLTGSTSAHIEAPSSWSFAGSSALATIVDDEPRISVSDVTKSEGKKGQTTLFTFTVRLSAAYDQAVTMSFKTVNGAAKTSDNDYVAKSGTLTFAPGETTKTITIEVKGDGKREAHEYFYLDLFGLSSNGLFTKNRGIGTILNDD
jgi:hypothetical protein